MSKISLFELSTEFRALQDLITNEEFDQETGELIDNTDAVNALFEEVQGTLGHKLDNTAFVIKNIEYNISSTQGEIDYLTKVLNEKKNKVKVADNKIKFLKELMSIALNASGEKKIDTGKFTFNRIVKKGIKVIIANEDELPREYVILKREPNKKLIKEMLKDGKNINGCSLADSIEFRIKG